MERDKKWDVCLNAEIKVSPEGKFVTNIDGQDVPAEIGEYGPEIGAIIFYDNNGIPNRAIFLESFG